MSEVILLDTGPLVAFYNSRDSFHLWAREEMDRMPEQVLTCDAVITEACHLLARGRADPTRILRAVSGGTLNPAFELRGEAQAVAVLMQRYANIPMSLADACLVRLSEIHRHCRVFTLDRHFVHYRRYGRAVIPLISPW